MTGVLAVQGDFLEHEKALEALGEEWFEIRKPSDLDRHFDRLIFPGGESTVQSKLIKELGMFDRLKEAIDSGIPVFATCAGLILLCDKSSGADGCAFRTIPANVKRNAYGRQLGSFYTEGEFKGLGTIPMEFIRAPYIESIDDGVEVMSVTDGQITGVRYKNQLAVSFHPELCDDTKIFEYFLNM
ncbi:MAG: pyridoxal 5'-phosphate synthase glutaminase subunit PdxT [Clostridiales bacterium]|nr:pyridoxal 5'-phosphate synthase glutaminase subunit PdxT [Clostridiales bacterium]